MDASKSIGPHSWQIDLDAASNIAESFAFGCKDDPRVGGAQAEMGVIEFSTDVKTQQQFTCDKDQFLTAVRGLKQPCDNHDPDCKAYTATGDAMAAVQTMFSSSARPNSAKVLVLITDGVPCVATSPNPDVKCTQATGTACSCFHHVSDGNNTDPQPDLHQASEAATASAAMQKGGIVVVGIAVGKEFGSRGRSFMEGIVSKPTTKYLFTPDSWQKLPALVKSIVESICPPPH